MKAEIEAAMLLLLVAAVVAIFAKRLHFPYSVGLVVAGIVFSAVPFAPRIVLTKEVIYTGLLPPLLFEASYHLHWDRLKRNFPVIGVLATLGVALSGVVSAAGMHFLAHWQWISALVFGALIAATDPVAVIATFRESGAKGRLPLLIEAESLLNDGTASVAFGIVVAIASGFHPSAGGVALEMAKSICGGVACGVAVGMGALLLTGRTNDHLIELTFTTVAAYGSFLLADSFGASGVLATISAGLVMSNFNSIDAISKRGKEAIERFWAFAAFISNSLVFLLIGTRQSTRDFLAVWLPTLIGIAVVLLGRACAVYFCSSLLARSSLRISARHQHALVWGGLRGALALALALGLPPHLPLHNEIVTVSFAVVAFSILVQGLTMPLLLRRIGEIPGDRGKPEARPESASVRS
jgi:monovalent cation:H+ antiporter, CPA1 family